MQTGSNVNENCAKDNADNLIARVHNAIDSLGRDTRTPGMDDYRVVRFGSSILPYTQKLEGGRDFIPNLFYPVFEASSGLNLSHNLTYRVVLGRHSILFSVSDIRLFQGYTILDSTPIHLGEQLYADQIEMVKSKIDYFIDSTGLVIKYVASKLPPFKRVSFSPLLDNSLEETSDLISMLFNPNFNSWSKFLLDSGNLTYNVFLNDEYTVMFTNTLLSVERTIQEDLEQAPQIPE